VGGDLLGVPVGVLKKDAARTRIVATLAALAAVACAPESSEQSETFDRNQPFTSNIVPQTIADGTNAALLESPILTAYNSFVFNNGLTRALDTVIAECMSTKGFIWTIADAPSFEPSTQDLIRQSLGAYRSETVAEFGYGNPPPVEGFDPNADSLSDPEFLAALGLELEPDEIDLVDQSGGVIGSVEVRGAAPGKPTAPSTGRSNARRALSRSIFRSSAWW
jgi:hypothetical protein